MFVGFVSTMPCVMALCTVARVSQQLGRGISNCDKEWRGTVENGEEYTHRNAVELGDSDFVTVGYRQSGLLYSDNQGKVGLYVQVPNSSAKKKRERMEGSRPDRWGTSSPCLSCLMLRTMNKVSNLSSPPREYTKTRQLSKGYSPHGRHQHKLVVGGRSRFTF